VPISKLLLKPEKIPTLPIDWQNAAKTEQNIGKLVDRIGIKVFTLHCLQSRLLVVTQY
jgi:hypothetical protein